MSFTVPIEKEVKKLIKTEEIIKPYPTNYNLLITKDLESMKPTDIRRELENLEVVYFPVAQLFRNFREDYPLGGLYLLGKPGTFWPIS